MDNYSWGLEDDYLAHYGVLGMKWGVRRYQNKDGSYTREGLARFQKSYDSYERSKSEYKIAKQSGNKSLAKQHKNNMKIAKGNMKRNYAQLKQDELADKGKQLYKEGYRVRSAKTLNKVAKATTTAAVGAYWLHTLGVDLGVDGSIGNTTIRSSSKGTVASLAILAAGTSVAAKAGDAFIYGPKNKQLQAYYSHSRFDDVPLNRIYK